MGFWGGGGSPAGAEKGRSPMDRRRRADVLRAVLCKVHSLVHPIRDPPQIRASPQEIPHTSQQAHKYGRTISDVVVLFVFWRCMPQWARWISHPVLSLMAKLSALLQHDAQRFVFRLQACAPLQLRFKFLLMMPAFGSHGLRGDRRVCQGELPAAHEWVRADVGRQGSAQGKLMMLGDKVGDRYSMASPLSPHPWRYEATQAC